MTSETTSFRPSKRNKRLIEDLEKLAIKENRMLNNYIETVLLAHVKAKGKPIQTGAGRGASI